MMPEDHLGVAHAGDAAIAADVGGDAFERHDGAGAGLFGDLRLFGRDDVHDDAALEHLCEADFDGPRSGLCHDGDSEESVCKECTGVSLRGDRRTLAWPGSFPVRKALIH